MQRFKWGIISVCSLAVVLFSAFIILKNKNQHFAESPSGMAGMAVSALLGDAQNSYRINDLPYKYTTEDMAGNKKDLTELVGEGCKMVLRYSELNCDVCIDSAFSYFMKFSQRVGDKNVVLLVEYKSADYLAQLIRMNHINLPNIYRITGKAGSRIPDEAEEAPFLFVLDSSRQMKDVFYPLKEIPTLSEIYYNTIFEKYFKK